MSAYSQNDSLQILCMLGPRATNVSQSARADVELRERVTRWDGEVCEWITEMRGEVFEEIKRGMPKINIYYWLLGSLMGNIPTMSWIYIRLYNCD